MGARRRNTPRNQRTGATCYNLAMALRNLLGGLLVTALVFGCGKSKGSASTAELDKRCDALATACADTDKHIAKLGGECKDTAKTQTEKGCADLAVKLYNCYENAVCGTGDKVWALPDLKVLADRHKKCDAEQTALTTCMGK